MTLKLKLTEASALRLRDGESTFEQETQDDELVEGVKAMADALDQVRLVISEVSLATLVAEVRQVPTEVVCAALYDLANAGERAIATLREAAVDGPSATVGYRRLDGRPLLNLVEA